MAALCLPKGGKKKKKKKADFGPRNEKEKSQTPEKKRGRDCFPGMIAGGGRGKSPLEDIGNVRNTYLTAEKREGKRTRIFPILVRGKKDEVKGKGKPSSSPKENKREKRNHLPPNTEKKRTKNSSSLP